MQTIIDASEETWLYKNPTKCELIALDLNQISHLAIFIDFEREVKEDMILLGAPIIKVWLSTTHYKRRWMTKYCFRTIITAQHLRCDGVAQILLQHALAAAHLTHVKMQRPLNTGSIWSIIARWTDNNTHRRPWWRQMATSQPSSKIRWTWNEELEDAGDFCIFGICCVYAYTTHFHTSVTVCEHEWHSCWQHCVNMMKPFAK